MIQMFYDMWDSVVLPNRRPSSNSAADVGRRCGRPCWKPPKLWRCGSWTFEKTSLVLQCDKPLKTACAQSVSNYSEKGYSVCYKLTSNMFQHVPTACSFLCVVCPHEARRTDWHLLLLGRHRSPGSKRHRGCATAKACRTEQH